MEMMIPGMTVSQGTAALQSTASPKAGTGASPETGFQQVLVEQISTGTAISGEQGQPTAVTAIMAQLEAIATDTAAGAMPATEELLALLDGLLDSLHMENMEEKPATEDQLEQLQNMLDSLNALLGLLGIPVPVPQTTQSNMELQNAGDSLKLAVSQANTNLQDSLLQLQTFMQYGTLKQVQGQEPLKLIAGQLQALAAALNSGDGDVSTETKTSANEQNVPVWLNVQSSPAREASSLLQRLTAQAVHPSFYQAVAAVAEEQGSATQDAVVATVSAEPSGGSAPAQLPFVSPENIREFAPLLTKSQAPTAFVLADEFAETMNGLIVQKFDVRTVNGLSEAKLILFPEQLGQVDVRISMQNGLLTAVFQADTAAAKDMLENQMAQLRAALQAQGLTIEKLEVTQSPVSSGLSQQFTGQGQGHQGQQPFGNRQGFRDGELVKDAAFEPELVEQAAIQGLGYGRAINETA
ncbi:flagellar hook-length control protein FliK [Paenibacillus sp. GCM10027627]|uniref:flagellar hook-length control protein FliK n=1 Tax=unclassified Paenibacillus TaxID=185978 RepID=UPI00362EF83E